MTNIFLNFEFITAALYVTLNCRIILHIIICKEYVSGLCFGDFTVRKKNNKFLGGTQGK